MEFFNHLQLTFCSEIPGKLLTEKKKNQTQVLKSSILHKDIHSLIVKSFLN